MSFEDVCDKSGPGLGGQQVAIGPKARVCFAYLRKIKVVRNC